MTDSSKITERIAALEGILALPENKVLSWKDEMPLYHKAVTAIFGEARYHGPVSSSFHGKIDSFWHDPDFMKNYSDHEEL